MFATDADEHADGTDDSFCVSRHSRRLFRWRADSPQSRGVLLRPPVSTFPDIRTSANLKKSSDSRKKLSLTSRRSRLNNNKPVIQPQFMYGLHHSIYQASFRLHNRITSYAFKSCSNHSPLCGRHEWKGIWNLSHSNFFCPHLENLRAPLQYRP